MAVVSRMRASEADAVAAIAARCMPRGSTADELRAELGRPYADVWVARERAGDPIGAYAIVWTVDDSELLIVATDPSRRRRGLAREILEQAIAAVRQRGARTLHLEVRPSNAAARALYEALGFVEHDRRRRYYGDGEDALVLALELTPAPAKRC